MKSLAALVVRGRLQAVAVATAGGILAFLLPPYSSVLNYLAGAVIALVTLHIGALPGLQVLLLSGVITVLFFQLLGIQSAVVLATVTLFWLPCWLLGMVLRESRQLGTALKAAALFGVCLLIMVYAMFGNPAPWWVERLHDLQQLMAAAGIEVPAMAEPELLGEIARLMTGLLLASVVLGVLSGLLLARWWQSVIVRPGAFRDEFQALRLGHAAGTGTLVVMLLAYLAGGLPGDFAAQAALIILVPYLLVGLAVIHGLVRMKGRGVGWLVAVYALLALMPQAMLMLAAAGLLDTWIDFRRRFAAGADT